MGSIYGSDSRNNISSEMSNNINFDDQLIKRIAQSHGIYERGDMPWYTKFSRWNYFDPYDTMGKTREFIFMTKPDLNLFKNGDVNHLNDELKGIPFFEDAIRIWPESMKQLQSSASDNNSPFMNLITNSVNSSIDLPSIDADYIETASTYQGFSMQYRQASFDSDFHPEFSLEFEDSKYLEIYMVFRIYDEYQRLKKDGCVSPPSMNYIRRRELHDQWGVYKIIVDEDGESILHYSQILGVSSKNAPRETFGNLSEYSLKFSISFKGTVVRDMRPETITAFNRLVGVTDYDEKNSDKDIPIYDTDLGMINGAWVNKPYINTYEVDNWKNMASKGINPIPRYKLKWR